ncbi:MAG: chemotaxis protein CheA [Okeania sp. SIO3I5]|uniref:chemotaxis protein CheW n=1 Tax=Okeania sp. SIO3I5 TaxID=2607805 RepID=UPI0013B92250|nr:chemotaxis protein CheW [Okeania sp. SIO3I5]NEQ36477.1 chemotaxis protein CheA [Okeania sp. SIO3I5]
MEIDEDVKAFLVDSYETLNQLESDLVELEQHPTNPELMQRIYRSLHTLKGNSGFLGLDILQSVAHAGENLLTCLEDGRIILNPQITGILLQVIDAIKQILSSLEATGEEGDNNYNSLLENLASTTSSQQTEKTQTEVSSPPENPSPELEQVDNSPQKSTIGHTQQTVSEQLLPGETKQLSNTPETSSISPSSADSWEDIYTISATSNISDSYIRVDVQLLNKLMNLVGELVLCRNQILEFTNQQTDTVFADTSQRLDLVTTELQEGVMKTRMQPIRTIWSKFPRVVRDLSMSLGKEVNLEMEGEETELDKTLIEAISAPLTHLVRNCVDHGIEPPDIRTAKGKPPIGTLWLRAFHESGYVNIEVGDDGAGINVEKIKAKALQRHLITNEQASRLTPTEALNLIFIPGFSTAQQVTNVSGRGVGMDVVRTNIEKISGTIDISSQVNQGTTFKLKIPLTLAIIPTLIITTNGDRYALPQVSLLELVRLEGEEAKKGVEMVHGAPVYRLRGNLLPLIYLKDALELEANQSQRYPLATPWLESSNLKGQNHNLDILNIVVLQAANQSFGLVVDAINDTQEIVVKPLGKQLKGISCFAGATIMGDGRVALILDVQGLAETVHVISEETDSQITATQAESEETSDELEMLLLFAGPDHRRMAITRSRVARLEEFPISSVERIGNQKVIQYREQILPLIYLSELLGRNQLSSQRENFSELSTIQVVVVAMDEDNLVGFVVEQILDIVEQEIKIKGAATEKGIDYAAVIQERVTEILDVEEVIKMANLKFLSNFKAQLSEKQVAISV